MCRLNYQKLQIVILASNIKMKYRIPITSYVVIEAESGQEAVREVEAQREKPYADRYGRIESDLLSNCDIGIPTVEEQWQE